MWLMWRGLAGTCNAYRARMEFDVTRCSDENLLTYKGMMLALRLAGAYIR